MRHVAEYRLSEVRQVGPKLSLAFVEDVGPSIDVVPPDPTCWDVLLCVKPEKLVSDLMIPESKNGIKAESSSIKCPTINSRYANL